MVALIFGSVLLGTWRSLSALERELEVVFMRGVDGDGFSIQNDLVEIIAESYNLMTVAKKRMPEDSAEIAALAAARDALISAGSPTKKYAANLKVYEASTELYQKFKDAAGVTEADMNLAKRCYAEIQSRNDTMKNDGYNAEARKFNEKIKGVPAVFIAPLVGISPAELFE